MAEDRPLGAFALSLAAGVLIVLEAVGFSLASSIAGDLGAAAASDVLGGPAFLGVLVGLIVILFAALLYRNPEHHAAYGVVHIVLSLASLIVGGGFFLGTLRGVIGGGLAIAFDSSEEDEMFFDPSGLPIARATASRPEARSTQLALCENRGLSIPLGESQCPSCETPVRTSAGATAST